MTKIIILGTAQDGGIPHFMCKCNNCVSSTSETSPRFISSIGILGERKAILIDATSDIAKQFRLFQKHLGEQETDGILITHLHMGHYVGLLHFGTEGISSQSFPIYVTKENYLYLLTNKPFSYLFTKKQMEPVVFKPETKIYLDGSTTIHPFEVVHRNEDGNTLGLEITDNNTNKKAIFISDIDKITEDVVKRINSADKVIFDGTFYQHSEIQRQNNVPHPPIADTVKAFGKQPENIFYFTHFNHSNPVLNPNSEEFKQISAYNYNICKEGDVIEF